MDVERTGINETIFEVEQTLPLGVARIMRLQVDAPADNVFLRDSHYWLDMCLTPRPEKARGSYHDRWGPHRFERLGEVFLVPPGETVHILSDTGTNQRSVVCEIDRSAVDRWLSDDVEWTDRRLEAGLDIAHPHIRACLLRLAEELRNPGAGAVQLAEMIIGQLAIELARYIEAIAEGPVKGGLSSWRLRQIDVRLAQTGTPPSLADLAAICGLSVRQLTRGFRTSRGYSIGDHIALTRIETAKRMLASNESIKSIAFDLGFSSPSSFSYAFRRLTGLTPSRFRQRQGRPDQR